MKLILNESLPPNESRHFTADQRDNAEGLLSSLLKIEGVKGYYHVLDFVALERFPKASWEKILSEVKDRFGEEQYDTPDTAITSNSDEHYGEVGLAVQMFRGIPIQVKLTVGAEDKRVGLPDRFMNAVMEAQASSDNMIMERKWVEQAPRYGEPEDIERDVVEELTAAYDTERLKTLVKRAFEAERNESPQPFHKVTIEQLEHPDWRERYRILDRMDPSIEDLPVLEKALKDAKVSIRRLAVVYLGMLKDPAVLPFLYDALADKTITVRRTAGDTLSDIGDPAAIPAMIQALKDPSRIVRWRAAMFLYETGDETAVAALKEAQDDPEFEVALQIKMALQRIEGGIDAKGSVWKQMTEMRKQN